MVFFLVLWFFLLLSFGSVDSWAVCESTNSVVATFSGYVKQTNENSNSPCWTLKCNYNCEVCPKKVTSGGWTYTNITESNYNCTGFGAWCEDSWCANQYGNCRASLRCSTPCEADSARGCPEGMVWSSSYCACVSPPPPPKDTTWVCQNAGGPEPGGFGGPRVAKLFKCYDGSCHNTRDLSGTCQDWGFCDDGVDDCEIADSLGTPPCGRSGSRFITSSKCVYACADGKDLSCTPVSTGYVAGNIYAGECPSLPPDGCRPSSSSSGASSSGSSSPSSGASSSLSNTDWRDTINPGNGGQLDYTRILTAILDTLHRANVQRDFVLDLENNMSLDLDNISNYSEYSYQQLSNLNSKGSAINTALEID